MANLARTNKILMVVAASLLLLSFLSYQQSVRRADRFERGQKLLPNLDPDEVAQIQITKGDGVVRLVRQGEDRFVVASADGYRAANEAVNRFLRDLLDATLEREVGTADDGVRAKLGLVAGEGEAVDVELRDAAEKAMVHLVVGDAFEGGSGNYVLRAANAEGAEGGGTVYLTSGRLYLTTDSDGFVDKDLVDVAEAEVTAVRGDDFTIARGEDGGELALQELPEGTKETAKAKETARALAALRFTKHHLANAPEVAGLRFDGGLEFELGDGSGYRVSVAQEGDKHYLAIQGFHTTERVEVSLDASEEEVKDTSEVLVRIEEIEAFNTFHGSWIYEVSSYVADKFRVTKKDLFEKA